MYKCIRYKCILCFILLYYYYSKYRYYFYIKYRKNRKYINNK